MRERFGFWKLSIFHYSYSLVLFDLTPFKYLFLLYYIFEFCNKKNAVAWIS